MADDEFPARSCRYVSRRRPEQSTRFERPICPQLSNAGSTGAGVSFVHTPRLQKLVRLWKPTRVWSARPRFSCCCFCCFPSSPNPILALRLHHHRVSVRVPRFVLARNFHRVYALRSLVRSDPVTARRSNPKSANCWWQPSYPSYSVERLTPSLALVPLRPPNSSRGPPSCFGCLLLTTAQEHKAFLVVVACTQLLTNFLPTPTVVPPGSSWNSWTERPWTSEQRQQSPTPRRRIHPLFKFLDP